MNKKKLLQKILRGSRNTRFSEIVSCAEAFGFSVDRIRGSHHILVHPDIPELLNLQEVGGKAKDYQVRQFLNLVETYNLKLWEDK